MLLQDDGRPDRSLEAMGLVMIYHFAKGSQGSTLEFPVVRHVAEESLNQRGRSQRLNQTPLFFGECLGPWLGFHGAKAITR